MTTSILNLNCWLMPWNLSSDNTSRLSAIVAMIEKLNPDIITLQEIWSNKYISSLKNKLPRYTFAYSKTLFYNQSGLLTLLKEPPLNYCVSFFKRSFSHNFAELIFHKGFISTEIIVDGKLWTIVNTHLYAAFSKKSMEVEKQTRALFASLPATPVILCGDLNLIEKRFNIINRGEFSRLGDSQATVSRDNPYAYAKFNSYFMGKASKKVDYMLIKNSLFSCYDYEVIKTPIVSDHYPIFIRLNI